MKPPKIIIHQEPEPKRKDSFWFDGHVATVTDGKNVINIIAQGEIRVAFNIDEEIFRNKMAVKEAHSRDYTDTKLSRLSKHDGWSNNNWFAFEVVKEGQEPYWDNATDIKFDDAIHTAKRILKIK